MRNNKEILEILLDNVERIRAVKGLCYLASHLASEKTITWHERNKILAYIEDNRPFMFSSMAALSSVGSGYYWPKYEVEPRAKWLKKHIKKLS
jgi:hypothetical protein